MSKKMIAITAAVVGAFVSLVASPAYANSSTYSTDSNHGAFVYFTSNSARLTVQDTAYDGWGAEGIYVVGTQTGECIEERGYNTSDFCVPNSGLISSIVYKACLEHNHGTTTSYCSAFKGDPIN